ncbi:MAG: hypothetical protein AB9921_02540 [Erysipelotrichaceae bacterium]
MKAKASEVAFRHSRFNQVMETIVHSTPVEFQKKPVQKPEQSALSTREKPLDQKTNQPRPDCQ